MTKKTKKRIGVTPKAEINYFQVAWTDKAIKSVEEGKIGKAKGKGIIPISPNFELVICL